MSCPVSDGVCQLCSLEGEITVPADPADITSPLPDQPRNSCSASDDIQRSISNQMSVVTNNTTEINRTSKHHIQNIIVLLNVMDSYLASTVYKYLRN